MPLLPARLNTICVRIRPPYLVFYVLLRGLRDRRHHSKCFQCRNSLNLHVPTSGSSPYPHHRAFPGASGPFLLLELRLCSFLLLNPRSGLLGRVESFHQRALQRPPCVAGHTAMLGRLVFSLDFPHIDGPCPSWRPLWRPCRLKLLRPLRLPGANAPSKQPATCHFLASPTRRGALSTFSLPYRASLPTSRA